MIAVPTYAFTKLRNRPTVTSKVSSANDDTVTLCSGVSTELPLKPSVQVEAPSVRVRPLREKHLRKTQSGLHEAGLEQPFHTSVRFEGPDDELRQTINTQPALYVTSCAALEALRSAAEIQA